MSAECPSEYFNCLFKLSIIFQLPFAYDVCGRMDDMNERQKLHTLSLTGRKSLCITGVAELIAFDEESVLLGMDGTQLNIGGSGLSVTRLSLESGEIDICGKIDSIVYAEDAPVGKSFVARLFGRE